MHWVHTELDEQVIQLSGQALAQAPLDSKYPATQVVHTDADEHDAQFDTEHAVQVVPLSIELP